MFLFRRPVKVAQRNIRAEDIRCVFGGTRRHTVGTKSLKFERDYRWLLYRTAFKRDEPIVFQTEHPEMAYLDRPFGGSMRDGLSIVTKFNLLRVYKSFSWAALDKYIASRGRVLL